MVSEESQSQGRKAREIVTKVLDEKFAYYMKTYGWTVKGNPEGTLRKFFEWGFTDGVSLGIDLGKKAALGEPMEG